MDIVILKSDALSQSCFVCFFLYPRDTCVRFDKTLEELIFSKFAFLFLHIHFLILTPSLAYFCVVS